MKERQGGFFGNTPEFLMWVWHSIVGHPKESLEPSYAGWHCTDCGAIGLNSPNAK